MFNSEKYSKYLPSKQFTIIAGGILVLVAIIFVIFFMWGKGESFGKGEENQSALKVENQTIFDLVNKDTDQDGVADWEESLWGTDKNKKITFNDTPDGTYIENKKKELRIGEAASVNEERLTETEKFARQFFTSYTALHSSGEVDIETINNFSNSLGQKIVNPVLEDKYKESDAKTSEKDALEDKLKYYAEIKYIFQGYKEKGVGTEIDIINKMLGKGEDGDSTEEYGKLAKIASSYQEFAKKVMVVGVPVSLMEYHLLIANNANNTGISVLNMAKMINDPIVGLSGLSQYQKYSEGLVRSVADLEVTIAEGKSQ